MAGTTEAWTLAGKRAHHERMYSWAERVAKAECHVVIGHYIIERQRAIIARQKALGSDTTISEELLALFEKSQKVFEGDLLRINAERL